MLIHSEGKEKSITHQTFAPFKLVVFTYIPPLITQRRHWEWSSCPTKWRSKLNGVIYEISVTLLHKCPIHLSTPRFARWGTFVLSTECLYRQNHHLLNGLARSHAFNRRIVAPAIYPRAISVTGKELHSIICIQRENKTQITSWNRRPRLRQEILHTIIRHLPTSSTLGVWALCGSLFLRGCQNLSDAHSKACKRKREFSLNKFCIPLPPIGPSPASFPCKISKS